MARPMARRAMTLSAGSALFLVLLMGFAHTPAGRPLLAAMARTFRGGPCPLGYDQAATPAKREQARVRFAATHRGEARAGSRPALGFELDHTSSADVVSFMATRHVTCRPVATAAGDLICDDVPGGILPSESRGNGARDLWFTFGERGKLIALVAVSRDVEASRISGSFAQVTEAVARQAGPPSRIDGQGDPASLAAGTLRQASREFAFADYFARARATNMGTDFMLTEEYRSLPN